MPPGFRTKGGSPRPPGTGNLANIKLISIRILHFFIFSVCVSQLSISRNFTIVFFQPIPFTVVSKTLLFKRYARGQK